MGKLFTLSRGKASRVGRPAPRIRQEAAQEIRRQSAQALGQILRPKLTLGAPDDAQEREADAVAERVMRMPDHPSAEDEMLRRKCATCQEEGDERVRRSPQPEEDEEEKVQAKANGAGTGTDSGSVATDTASRIQARRGGGTPLPASERAFFEPRFGADFSRVRLHADTESARLSGQVAARAFTVGSDVFLGPGEYRPGTVSGRYLLAHELTHTLQSGGQAIVRRAKFGIHSQRPSKDSHFGHAFVSLTDDENKYEAWGFYPACTDCSGFSHCDAVEQVRLLTVGWMKGRVCDDQHTWPSTSYYYHVDKDDYPDHRQAIIDFHPGRYDLYENNCVDYVREIAHELSITSMPDLPAVDDPAEFGDYVDEQVLFQSGLRIQSDTGAPVDLREEKPSFTLRNLPRDPKHNKEQHGLKFLWGIATPADTMADLISAKTYALESKDGLITDFQSRSKVFIPDSTREQMKKDNVRLADVFCIAVMPPHDEDAKRLHFRQRVSFYW